jgi:hypothetical protein
LNAAKTVARKPEMQKGTVAMTKSLDLITEVIRSTRHPFRQADNQPDKPHKNRYERRKIKEFIRLGDWAGETPSLQT